VKTQKQMDRVQRLRTDPSQNLKTNF